MRAISGYAISFDRLFNSIGTATTCLGKTKIVVGRNVERTGLGTQVYLGVVVIFGVLVISKDSAACHACDWLGETVIHAAVEAMGIKQVKVRVQRCVALFRNVRPCHTTKEEPTQVMQHQMSEIGFCEALSKEVVEVPEYDKDKIVEIGGEEDVVQRLVYLVF